jgi:FkbM family methyltransferase
MKFILPNPISYLEKKLYETSMTRTLLWLFPALPSSLQWRLGRTILNNVRRHGESLSPRVVRCKDGFKMMIDPIDFLGSHVALYREYEPGLSIIVRSLLQRGDHFVDIGANIGYFTLLAASQVCKEGHVSSFEASPIICKELRRNVSLNGFSDRVAIYQNAAYSEEKELTFYQGPSEHCGISSLRYLPNSAYTFRVSAVILDELISYKKFPIKFIKIDVEGAEYDVLVGISKILDFCCPFVALELTDGFLRKFGHSSEKVINLLYRKHKYFLYRYNHKGILEKFDIKNGTENQKFQLNLFFAPREFDLCNYPELSAQCS